MTIDEAVETVEYARAFNKENTPLMRAFDALISYVKAQKVAEKNEPLTREELDKCEQDVDRARHERWVFEPKTAGYKCSGCGFSANRYQRLLWDYCPKCGAPMWRSDG